MNVVIPAHLETEFKLIISYHVWPKIVVEDVFGVKGAHKNSH